jgi:hypothetical protein
LNKYNVLSDALQGTWKNEQYKLELKTNATPYHARALTVPKFNKATLKLEVQRLCDLGAQNVLHQLS